MKQFSAYLPTLAVGVCDLKDLLGPSAIVAAVVVVVEVFDRLDVSYAALCSMEYCCGGLRGLFWRTAMPIGRKGGWTGVREANMQLYNAMYVL